ncbi:hypothetical protein BVG19_g4587 [[Candida] boidinii]|nr:hypothetical protein BVG19_g4587 [[Candida] boidinii]OWB51645.1 hypothetical protein B5S27_g3210 [[Candida] boidinii]
MTEDADVINSQDKNLSKDEIALYDRQIRLWGVEAQRRMRNARVLIINLTSVAVEISKNLMLGGIGSLSIIDNSVVLPQDLNCNFFIDSQSIGLNKLDASKTRIQDLNLRVDLKTFIEDWESKDKNWFDSFDLVIATGLDKLQLIKLNNITRDLRLPLYSTSTHGLYGYIFVDLIEHESTVKKSKGNIPRKIGPINSVSEIVKVDSYSTENDQEMESFIVLNKYRKIEDIFQDSNESSSSNLLKEFYPSVKKLKKINGCLPILLSLLEFKSMLNIDINEVNINSNELKLKSQEICDKLGLDSKILITDELINEISRQAFTEFQPVSAIIGGAVSQDVINMFGKRENPINNFLIFDGPKSEMPIFVL